MILSDIELTNIPNINKFLDCFMNKIYIHEFEYNYDIIELGCLKEIIGIYVKKHQNQKTFIVYKNKNEKNKYFTYIIDKIEDTNIYVLDKLDDEQKIILKKYCCILIEIDIKKLQRIRLKILIKKNILDSDLKIYREKILKAGQKIVGDIDKIIDSIKNKTANTRGLIKYEGIKTRELIGYYKSKYFEIDAGEDCDIFSVYGKKIKMKYIFDEYNVFTLFDNKNHRIEFSNLLSKMYSEVFQTIINTPFISSPNQKYYGQDDNLSVFNYGKKYVEIEDTNLKKYVHIPNDINKLMDNYLKFDAMKQNAFYRSCKSLNNALISSGIKSLFYSYQAIENIAAYYETIGVFTKNSRSNNIKTLLIDYYDSSFPDDAHKFWDEYRNKFAHNGIEENELIEMAVGEKFDSFKPNKSDELFTSIVRKVILNILNKG